MTSSEDELVNSLIQRHLERQERIKDRDPDADDAEAYPEAHYNHYGNRGVADLYLTIGNWEGRLFEIKSESAVRNSTGANEIIRQFNKMREYFFKGSDHEVPSSQLGFELCFTASEHNIRHIAENADMYSSIVDQDFVDVYDGSPITTVTVRSIDNSTPIVFFSSLLDFREGAADTSFPEYVEFNDPELYDRFEDVFESIS